MTPEKSSAFVHDDSKGIDQIVGLLNRRYPTLRGAGAKVAGELRRLIAAWDDAGRDAGKMLEAVAELHPYLRDQSGLPSWRLAFAVVGSGLQFIPEQDVREVPSTTEPEIHEARLLFVRLLFNELRDSLAGPCQWKHCDKYFLLKGNRRTAYCSRQCCQYSAASRCTKRRLQREHADKLQRADKSARRRPISRTKDAWKAFVSKQDPEIKPKFLTRAVTNGELTANGKLTAKGKTFVKEHLGTTTKKEAMQ